MFSKIKTCPFCDSKKLRKITDKNLSNNFYVQEIINDLKISFDLLKKD